MSRGAVELANDGFKNDHSHPVIVQLLVVELYVPDLQREELVVVQVCAVG